MAQPIHCDYQGEPHLADTLVSRIANGETLAWCDPHYVEVCRAIADAVGDAEAAAADAEALARLEGENPASVPPTSPESSAVGDPPAEPPTNDVDGPARPKRGRKAAHEVNGRPGPPDSAVGDPAEAVTAD